MWLKEIDTIYDRYWKPIFRILPNWRFVDFKGKSYWFLDHDALFNYKGKQVGWFNQGLLRDLKWYVIGFWDKVTDPFSPFLPFKHLKPIPGLLDIEPIRPIKEIKKMKPFSFSLWSKESLSSLFNI